MPRPRTGTLRRQHTERGTSWAVAFRVDGHDFYVHLGGEWDGWTEERAVEEQRFLMAKVNRGEWEPPAGAASQVAVASPAPAASPPTFQVEASRWLHRYKLRADDPAGRSKSVRDLEWRLSVVMDVFGPVAVDRVDYALAESLVTYLCEERLAIAAARERGRPIMRSVTDGRTGRTYRTPMRGLSNSSIRKALDAAERVLRDAHRRGVLPTAPPDLKGAAPRAERVNRSFLQVEQIAAVLQAADDIEARHRGLTWEGVELIRSSDRSAVSLARELHVSDTLVRRVRRGELWKESPEPPNRNDIPRRVLLEVLLFAGLRISELCKLDAPQLDLDGERIWVPREVTKTPAGDRAVPMLPTVKARVSAVASQSARAVVAPAFPTRNGTRQHPDNVRSRILAPIRERANEILTARGSAPIARVTPHTLRRTFASILAVCDVPPRRAMYLMGHTNATLTLEIYQQVLNIGKGAVPVLEAAMGCSLDEARRIYNGEDGR